MKKITLIFFNSFVNLVKGKFQDTIATSSTHTQMSARQRCNLYLCQRITKYLFSTKTLKQTRYETLVTSDLPIGK